MYRAGLTILAATFAVSAAAAESAVEKGLRSMAPETRLVQVCNLESMARLAKDGSKYRPDRVMIDALKAPVIDNDNLLAGTGGAFRSKGAWYTFSFECRTTPDRMKVTSFTYKVGTPVPKDEWESYGLF